MLRITTIAILCVVNIAVWLTPMNTLVAYPAASHEEAARVDQAEAYEIAGNLKGSLAEREALVQENPENGWYRYDYALACYVHRSYLLDEAGWPETKVVDTVKRELYHARSLAKDDIHLPFRAALLLTNEEFFGNSVSRKQLIEAWQSVLDALNVKRKKKADWNNYPSNAAGALYQMARIEFRYDREDAARAYVEEARSIAPFLSIPKSLTAWISPT